MQRFLRETPKLLLTSVSYMRDDIFRKFKAIREFTLNSLSALF